MARTTSSNLTVPETPATNRIDAAEVSISPGRRSAWSNLIASLRPHQWTKNLLVFAALLFAEKLFDAAAVLATIEAFVVFCALSGVVYLINDVADRDSDRMHPIKRQRPIAAGTLTVSAALGWAAAITAAALAAAFVMSRQFGLIAVVYLALLALYSARLKHIVILDVLTISVGFVIRAAAGAVAISVAISHWLFVCTILLAMFIALAKRRHEIVLLADDATSHRPILGEYSAYLLDQMIAVVAASTLIAYIFYTISPETTEKFQTARLGLTIPFPMYGIFRYLYLVHQREGGGSPADLLISDRPLLICVMLWAVTVALIIYA
jgi:4-hydroxybenzoate polyprenyltransferase